MPAVLHDAGDKIIKPGANMIKGNPSSDVVHKILDRLSSDQEFREQMLGDPASALGSYNLEVDPDRIPAVRRLPSASALADMRQQTTGVADPATRVGLGVFFLK